jgi:hypothetical protein
VRALALCAVVLLGVFLVAEPAWAHSDSVLPTGSTERVEPVERAEPKREDCPARQRGSGGLRLVVPASPSSPLPSSARSRAAAYDSPADADPGKGQDATTGTPRAARQTTPLSRSGRSDELPVAYQVFRC